MQEPLRTTRVLIELEVEHQPGVLRQDMVIQADRWLKMNQLDLADRMGCVIKTQSVTTAKERQVNVSTDATDQDPV